MLVNVHGRSSHRSLKAEGTQCPPAREQRQCGPHVCRETLGLRKGWDADPAARAGLENAVLSERSHT